MPKTPLLPVLAVLPCLGPVLAQHDRPPPSKPDPQPPWRSVTTAPAWAAKPPARPDHYRFTTSRRSNLPSIAQHGATTDGQQAGTEHLLELLLPAIGADAAQRFATTAIAQRRELDRACSFVKLPGARGPGNTLATAWILWEVPIRPALAAIQPALRGRAERMLLTNPPPWQQVTTEPAWFRRPAPRDGWFRLGLQHEGVWHKDTRRQALAEAATGVQAALVRRLSAVLGEAPARRAAAAAVEDLRPVHRALWFRRRAQPKPDARYHTTAWVVWEVPLHRMQRAVGEELGTRLAATLTGRPR